MSVPTYIYKIVPASVPLPSPLPDALPVSDLDKADGFLHLSTALQLPETLKRYFVDVDRLFILRIEYKNVEQDVKWEDRKGIGRQFYPGGVGEKDMFPHIYNGLRIGKAEIESVGVWERDSNGWDTAIDRARSENWFIY
ncbi:hypothetical protein B0H34DRAFT_671106 [Crassisporium funariophilum]|nr:hypothetical protein B0H34DRAFT_671106 [Crassisporium funariophilum]